MEISELKNEGLARELRVVVPAAEVAQKTDARLAELAKNIQLPGFRKGKVPVSHLRRLYGRQIKAEVLQEALREAVEQTLTARGERAAYEPEVDVEGGEEAAKRVLEEDADLAIVMKYEVLPEVEAPEDFSDIAVTRYRVRIPDDRLDKAMEKLANEFYKFEEKPEDAPAEKGDRVTISFIGRIDGEEFEGGSAEHTPLVLGSGRFIPGFEDQLIGAKAGEERIVKVTFPQDYGVEKLAGKEAEFTVRVEKVEAPGEKEIDEEFAQRLGFDSLEALRERLRRQLALEYETMAEAELKQKVLDALDERYDFPVPEKLVNAEFESIWRAATEQMKQEGTTFEDEGTTEEEARKEYRELAERRVRLGLVIGAIGARAGVDVTEEELREALLAKAQQYPGQEQQVIEFYRKTPEALIELRGPIFESKVLDHILSSVQVTEKEVTPEELMKILEEEEEEGETAEEAKAAAPEGAENAEQGADEKEEKREEEGKEGAADTTDRE